MLEPSGATKVQRNGQYSVPGFCIHETGTARMGNDSRSRVVNRFNQAHDVKNIFVTDGTMMAITVRACDCITKEYAKSI